MKRFKYLAVAAMVALGACDEGGDLTPSEPITGSLTVNVSAEGENVDVTVAIAGPESRSAATTGGSVTFADLEAGAYAVTISGIPSGFAFATTAQTATIDTEGETVTVSFSGSIVRTASIAGQVTAGGTGVAGVTIDIDGPEGSQSAQTGANGNYSFTGLRGGSYDITMNALTNDQVECAAATVTRQLPAGGSAVADFGCTDVSAGDATISIQSITRGGLPVTLSNVFGQIEVALNVDRAGNSLDSAEVAIDGKVVATQKFAPAAVSGDEAQQAETIILSVATTQIVAVENGWAPAIFNGGASVSANLFVNGAQQPVPSNSVPIVMNNEDKVLLITDDLTLEGDTPEPNITVDGTLWQTGNAAFDGAIYLAYSGLMPARVDWPTVSGACDVSSSFVGTPSTGIVVTNDYDCSGDQGTVLPAVADIDAAYAAGTQGPDGSTLDPADNDDYVQLGATFELENEMRRFIVPLTPSFPSGFAVSLDNQGPNVWVDGEAGTPNAADKVAFNDLFDEAWVNAAREFIEDLHASDAGGVGIFIDPDDLDDGTDMSELFARVWEDDGNGSTNDCVGMDVEVGGDLDETITSDSDFGHQICAVGADALGNPAVGDGPSNFFGADFEAPEVRLAGSDGPNEGDILAPTEAVEPVSEDPDATIYNAEGDGAGLGTAPLAALWGLEALDDRAGFSQVAVTDPGDDGMAGTLDDISYPAHQVLQEATALGQMYCPDFADPLINLPLAGEPWVRSNSGAPLQCGLGNPGYYKYWGYVVDRAGNFSEMLMFNWLDDETQAATISAVSFGQTFYTPGEDAAFSVFGSDDLEVVGAALALDFPVPNRTEDLDDALSIDFGSFPVGERWGDVHGEDGEELITPLVAGAEAVLPGALVFGRVDFTDTDGTLFDYTVDPEEDFLATGMSAWLMDAGMNDNMDGGAGITANVETESFIPGQWTETTTAPWNDGTDLDEFIITWELQDQGGDRVAVHTASSSIVEPFFDNVLLVLNLQDGDGAAGGTPDTIIVCGMQATPTSINDNGINRFYSYNLFTAPDDPGDLDLDDPCETPPGGSFFHAVGVRGTAALVTSQSVSIGPN